MKAVCPDNICTTFPDETSQTLHVISLLEEAKYFASGEKSTEVTSFSWPDNVFNTFPDENSHIFQDLSELEDAKHFPPEENVA